MKKILLVFPCILLLTGCWSSQELDKSIIVQGVGLDKADNQLRMIVEMIKPTGPDTQGESSGSEVSQHIVLEGKTDSLMDGIREMIQYTKRRLFFEHNEIWVVSEKLAKDEKFLTPLDLAGRDQMFRLNSYLFITKNDPEDIFNTTTLYSDLSSIEIVSALNQTKHVAEFSSINLYEFFTLINGPIHSAYVPMVSKKKVGNQEVTSLEGTAVIKHNKMIGKLNTADTVGLNILLNEAKGGSITIPLKDGKVIAIEVTDSETTITPKLDGEQLDVTIDIDIEGTLAENSIKNEISEQSFKKAEETVSKEVKNRLRQTLEKLQHELKTDITGIGLKTYQAYPKQWKNIQSDWDDIFANANISCHVQTDITHPGLINKKTKNNPYQ
ncbi:Ger(x)C family spore germination protein [Lentibacillus sp. N15]|uniref:Ger(x)C family spore germination protein n=1 Tax=Lentibacillus songyuanensis TaxID=3136161 RepID=UPI0031BBBF96